MATLLDPKNSGGFLDNKAFTGMLIDTNGFGPTPPQGGGTMEKTQGNNALSFFFKRVISFSKMYPIILRNRFASIRRTCDNTAVLFSIGTPVSA